VTVAIALAVATIFGAGTFMLLQRDLLRGAAGLVLLSNAVTLFVMGAGLSRGAAPIHPLPPGDVSDPLVQAMALTAIVITFGVTALVLALVHGVYAAHGTVDQHDLREAEARHEAELERGKAA
jgi:multicomponent Na+:H+ antiporter subunit C